jgi:hypothetical protein
MPTISEADALKAPVAVPPLTGKAGKKQKLKETTPPESAGDVDLFGGMDDEPETPVLCPVASAAAGSGGPGPGTATLPAESSTESVFKKMFDQFALQQAQLDTTRQTAMQFNLDIMSRNIMHEMEGVTKSLHVMNNKIQGIEESNDEKFRLVAEQFESIKLDQTRQNKEFAEMLKAGPPASFAAVAGAAASSRGPAPPAPVVAHRAGPHGNPLDEKCVVLVKGFPEDLPKAVLEETLGELIRLLPLGDQAAVKHRIPMVDNKITLIFPTAGGAEGFLDKFRSEGFVYIDQGTQERTTLSASRGRPLAARRRGGATHPVYSAAEKILQNKPVLAGAKLTQKPSMRSGSMQSEFFAGLGRKVRPLFTIVFAEGPHETRISAVHFPAGGPFDPDECQLIRAAAAVQ